MSLPSQIKGVESYTVPSLYRITSSLKTGRLHTVGEPHWGNGYATEAAIAIVEFAFKDMDYHKVYARHFQSNPSSGRVLEKVGMQKEGILKEHIMKEGKFEDLVHYGIINKWSSQSSV
jgi:[ribosomal protein S5]-alanine N-acetyltransferase